MASGSGDVVIHEGWEKERRPPAEGNKKDKGKERSRDLMTDLNARLDKVELAMADEKRIWILEKDRDKFRLEVQGYLNTMALSSSKEVQDLKDSRSTELYALWGNLDSFREELAKMSRELGETGGDWSLCKMAITLGGGAAMPPTIVAPSKADIPKPKAFKGSRNAKEIDNFLWRLEQYFKGTTITEDAGKIDHASLYLEDTAMVWWRRRDSKEENEQSSITSWVEFKKELKRQFYSKNVAHEARDKLRRLSQRGNIREYMKEFSELILELPKFPGEEALFAFLDGLQLWEKMEVQRRGAQDLKTAIAIAESLIEYKKSDNKSKSSKKFKGKVGEIGKTQVSTKGILVRDTRGTMSKEEAGEDR